MITGWILPDKTFVPLTVGVNHQSFLAQNALALNKRFGTTFSKTATPRGLLDALNAGFVRLRLDTDLGTLFIEASSSKWPKLKSAVKGRLEGCVIPTVSVSLVDLRGRQADSVTFALSDSSRVSEIEDGIDRLRAGRL